MTNFGIDFSFNFRNLKFFRKQSFKRFKTEQGIVRKQNFVYVFFFKINDRNGVIHKFVYVIYLGYCRYHLFAYALIENCIFVKTVLCNPKIRFRLKLVRRFYIRAFFRSYRKISFGIHKPRYLRPFDGFYANFHSIVISDFNYLLYARDNAHFQYIALFWRIYKRTLLRSDKNFRIVYCRTVYCSDRRRSANVKIK